MLSSLKHSLSVKATVPSVWLLRKKYLGSSNQIIFNRNSFIKKFRYLIRRNAVFMRRCKLKFFILLRFFNTKSYKRWQLNKSFIVHDHYVLTRMQRQGRKRRRFRIKAPQVKALAFKTRHLGFSRGSLITSSS